MKYRSLFYYLNLLLLSGALFLLVLWVLPQPCPGAAELLKGQTTGKYSNPSTPAAVPLKIYSDIVMKRNIFIPTPKIIPASLPGPSPIKLTGIVFVPITPSLSAAFITNVSANTEGTYSEGDRLEGWVVKKIEKKRVILINAANEIRVLLLTSDALGGSSVEPTLVKPSAGPPVEFTDYNIDPATVANATPEEIARLIKQFPRESIYKYIDSFMGISRTEISPTVELDVYATKAVLLFQGSALPRGGEKINFGTGITADNTPTDSMQNFRVSSASKIYASFPNQGDLKGLTKVVTRWMNTADGTVAYMGAQPLNPTAANNYIFVEKKKGWPKGNYTVELFRVDTMEKIADGQFEMKE